MFMVDYEPGGAAQAHDHPFEEAYFFLGGVIEAELDGIAYKLRAGDVLFAGVGSTHGFYNTSGGRVRWIETRRLSLPAVIPTAGPGRGSTWSRRRPATRAGPGSVPDPPQTPTASARGRHGSVLPILSGSGSPGHPVSRDKESGRAIHPRKAAAVAPWRSPGSRRAHARGLQFEHELKFKLSKQPPSASTSNSKHLTIAYLSFAVENSYDAPMLAAAEAVASDNNATLKVFDANNSPQTQYSQLQDVITSGQYNGIILQPIFGTGLISLVQQAIAKGIKVVNMDQVLGPNYATDAPQVAGLAANVMFVPTEIGTKLGNMVVQACQSKNLNPCNVGYLYDIKASALDVAISGAFNKAIAADPAVKVVAQGQSFFSPTVGLTAVQNMLTANANLNLIVGSDQGIEGGVQAVAAKHLTGKVILVGYGASAAALAGVERPADRDGRADGRPEPARRRSAAPGHPAARDRRHDRGPGLAFPARGGRTRRSGDDPARRSPGPHRARRAGQTLVIVTHDTRIAATADRMIAMRDGAFIDQTRLQGGTTGSLASLAGLEG